MSTETTTDAADAVPVTGTLLRNGSAALLGSVLVNVALVATAGAAGIGEGLEPLTYLPVVILTTAGVLGATVVYAALDRWISAPDRTFAGLAAVVLALSILPDVLVIPGRPGGSLTAGLVLAAMHVVTAALCVWFLVDRDALRGV